MKTISRCAALVLALLLPVSAHAQGGAGPQSSPKAGEEVIVTQSASGEELHGRMVELSGTTLAMLVNGQRVDVPIDNVVRIDARTDSVTNGALIGGGIMLVSGVFACAAGVTAESGQCVGPLVFNTLFGVLAGMGIDALHKGRTTIYSKPSRVALAVAPAGKGVRGQLKLTW